jgi:hypothetical protein
MRQLVIFVILASSLLHAQGGIGGNGGIGGKGGIGGGTTSSGTITLVEAVGSLANGTTDTFNITVTSTNSNDSLVVLTRTYGPSACNSSTEVVTDNKSGGSSTYTNQWSTSLFGGGDCLQLWTLLNTASTITQLTFTMGTGNDYGGMLILHFHNTIAWTGTDQCATMTGTLQNTPWASASFTTTHNVEALVGEVNIHLATYNSGIQNAMATTGSWTATAICDQSTSSPCINATTGKLDAGNGGILGGGYWLPTATQTSVAFTGTNNGSTNVYDDYPGYCGIY